MKMYKSFLKNVPLNHIRHNDLPCYVTEGFGARPIEEWPIYTFFQQYLLGETESAKQNFENWYKDQLNKYHSITKVEGGMYKGSLYSLVEKECKVSFSKVDESCKNAAIRTRVEQRFQLLEDMKEYGYSTTRTERIDVVRKNGSLYLTGGHHRVAALLALGEKELPNVLVFRNLFIYNLFNLLRSIKHGHLQK